MAEAISKMSQEVFEAQGPSSLDPVPPYLRHPPDLHEIGPRLLQRPQLQGMKPMEWRSLLPVWWSPGPRIWVAGYSRLIAQMMM